MRCVKFPGEITNLILLFLLKGDTLCVHKHTLAGVTATVKRKRPKALAGSSHSGRKGSSSPARMHPMPPTVSATPVHLTWKLGEPGKYQKLQAPCTLNKDLRPILLIQSVKRNTIKFCPAAIKRPSARVNRVTGQSQRHCTLL